MCIAKTFDFKWIIFHKQRSIFRNFRSKDIFREFWVWIIILMFNHETILKTCTFRNLSFNIQKKHSTKYKVLFLIKRKLSFFPRDKNFAPNISYKLSLSFFYKIFSLLLFTCPLIKNGRHSISTSSTSHKVEITHLEKCLETSNLKHKWTKK